MPVHKTARIVFEVTPDLMAALEETADTLSMTKIGAIRLAVAILNEIVRQASHGGRLILREPDGRDRELWLPQLSPSPPAPPPAPPVDASN